MFNLLPKTANKRFIFTSDTSTVPSVLFSFPWREFRSLQREDTSSWTYWDCWLIKQLKMVAPTACWLWYLYCYNNGPIFCVNITWPWYKYDIYLLKPEHFFKIFFTWILLNSVHSTNPSIPYYAYCLVQKVLSNVFK